MSDLALTRALLLTVDVEDALSGSYRLEPSSTACAIIQTNKMNTLDADREQIVAQLAVLCRLRYVLFA